jgi:hypothetical protein
MSAKRTTGRVLLLGTLMTILPLSSASAGSGTAQAATGGPTRTLEAITVSDAARATLTDPGSRSGAHAGLSDPLLPPRVPAHGREPREIGEEEGGASTASVSSYLSYKGGWTQTAPKIYVLFWGDWSSTGDPQSERNYLLQFYSGVGGSAWNSTNTQYGYSCGTNALGCSNGVRIQNPAGQLRGYAYDSIAVPASPTVAQLEAEAQKAANYWSDRSVNAQYVIALPHGHLDQKSILQNFCAWHNYTWSLGSAISYTAFPYIPDRPTCGANKVNSGAAGTLDGVSILAGHEYVESMTDPFPNSWLDPDSNENADKCLQWQYAGYFRNTQFTTGTFAVEPNWSNYALQTIGSGCVFWS